MVCCPSSPSCANAVTNALFIVRLRSLGWPPQFQIQPSCVTLSTIPTLPARRQSAEITNNAPLKQSGHRLIIVTATTAVTAKNRGCELKADQVASFSHFISSQTRSTRQSSRMRLARALLVCIRKARKTTGKDFAVSIGNRFPEGHNDEIQQIHSLVRSRSSPCGTGGRSCDCWRNSRSVYR